MSDPADTVLSIRDLDVRFATPDREVHAVRKMSFDIGAGETVAVVGESGSGKSQTMMAAMGLLAKNGRAAGSVRYRGKEILGLSQRALNRIRGVKVGMIFQEPMTSLDPLHRIGRQIAEPLIAHRRLAGGAARARALELLSLCGIAEPERRLAAYPHELSGGERQRVMIAMAIANDPELLIADEPTTALDVTVQAQILDLLADLRRRLGMAIVFITHDIGLVSRLAQRLYVMRAGAIVEAGETAAVLAAPQHDYTRELLAAEPKGAKPPPANDAPVLLAARGVSVSFTLAGGLFRGAPLVLRAVDRLDLTLRRGQTIGIVGESGSGKSTLARAILRLVACEGTIRFAGADIGRLEGRALRAVRRELQVVFQDPFGSLSPRMTVGEIVSEGLLVHAPGLSPAERDRRASQALEEVRLDPATRNRYPHEFSGGQRQRIAIARAIILRPQVVVLDEPTSALDRSVQKQIIELLRRLQDELGLSYLFISHDLAVIRVVADWVMVMKDGHLVESGPTETVFRDPREPYTRNLMDAAFAYARPGAAA